MFHINQKIAQLGLGNRSDVKSSIAQLVSNHEKTRNHELFITSCYKVIFKEKFTQDTLSKTLMQINKILDQVTDEKIIELKEYIILKNLCSITVTNIKSAFTSALIQQFYVMRVDPDQNIRLELHDILKSNLCNIIFNKITDKDDLSSIDNLKNSFDLNSQLLDMLAALAKSTTLETNKIDSLKYLLCEAPQLKISNPNINTIIINDIRNNSLEIFKNLKKIHDFQIKPDYINIALESFVEKFVQQINFINTLKEELKRNILLNILKGIVGILENQQLNIKDKKDTFNLIQSSKIISIDWHIFTGSILNRFETIQNINQFFDSNYDFATTLINNKSKLTDTARHQIIEMLDRFCKVYLQILNKLPPFLYDRHQKLAHKLFCLPYFLEIRNKNFSILEKVSKRELLDNNEQPYTLDNFIDLVFADTEDNLRFLVDYASDFDTKLNQVLTFCNNLKIACNDKTDLLVKIEQEIKMIMLMYMFSVGNDNENFKMSNGLYKDIKEKYAFFDRLIHIGSIFKFKQTLTDKNVTFKPITVIDNVEIGSIKAKVGTTIEEEYRDPFDHELQISILKSLLNITNNPEKNRVDMFSQFLTQQQLNLCFMAQKNETNQRKVILFYQYLPTFCKKLGVSDQKIMEEIKRLEQDIRNTKPYY